MFKPAQDMPYVDFLTTLHQTYLFDWYMEIGCRYGTSFAPVRSKTIAVDPFFRIKTDIVGAKPQLMVFQQTSDDFFANGMLQRLGVRVGLSFLDGMHLFEYLLRDFINTEANSDPDGVILMHDCCPFNDGMTTRDLDNLPRGAWTGDVWKLIPILQTYRPDLRVDVLGCKPTGLVAVSGLDPDNQTLRRAYDSILADWTPVELARYSPARLYGAFDYTPAESYLGPQSPIHRIRLPEDQALAPSFVSP